MGKQKQDVTSHDGVSEDKIDLAAKEAGHLHIQRLTEPLKQCWEVNISNMNNQQTR